VPDFVPPMMAESVKAPFDSPDWIFEIKLDGYRAMTVFDPAASLTLRTATRPSSPKS
jgi:bifunctional non-homologous end joining protein LigD